jgi:hypothetical protein
VFCCGKDHKIYQKQGEEMNVIPVSDVLDKIEDLTAPLLKNLIINIILKALPSAFGPFWVKIIVAAITFIFDKFIIPCVEDLELDAIVFVKKQELRRKVIKYEKSETDEEFNDSFDNLISGSKVR